MNELKELEQFLQPNQRIELKAVSLTHVLGLTGTKEGKELLFAADLNIIPFVFGLTSDASAVIAKDAVLTLINLTAEEENAVKVFEISQQCEPKFNIISTAIENIINPESELADPWTMVLSNLTRVEQLVGKVLDELEKDEKTILTLVKSYAKIDFNKKKHKLNYLGPIFCNLTQTSRGRELFCRSKHNLLKKVLPFASFESSNLRRGGTIGILRNICFDPVYHDIILDGDDFLYALLYPLAGPEEFTDEENDTFPVELQYLGEDKKREEDPDLRRMLLEALLQLCATKKYRELLRSKGTYEILREYHKWEANVGDDKNALLACENVVDILIKKEEEIGLDNIKEVEVPEDWSKKFVEEDQQYIES